MKLKDLREVCTHQPIRAYNAGNGKIVFDTYRNKKAYIERFEECTVDTIWTEVHSEKPLAFMQNVRQYICVYLHSWEVENVQKNSEVE